MKHILLFISLISIALSAHCQVIFQEDFDNIGGPTAGGAGTYSFPAGWLLMNVDNHTPAGAVSYVNQAWERREDFNFSVVDSCAFSTSWYTPAGAADDWMWTPVLGPLPAYCRLKWNAVTYDPMYPDGYEVRIMTVAPTGSTGNIGNMVTNSTVLFSTGAENTSWTSHEVDLSAYSGQSVYIGFRNNSNDKFLLLIDDVVVEQVIDYDIQITGTDTISQYTQIPLLQDLNAGRMGATLKNAGINTLNEVTLNIQVSNEEDQIMYNSTATYNNPLASGATIHLTTAAFTPMFAGKYIVHYTADMSETDQVPGNDTLSVYAFEITDTIYARDNNNIAGSLGIGAGNGGYLGQDFHISEETFLSSVSIYYTRGYSEEPFAAAIWNMNGGKPDTIVATTDTSIYPDNQARLYTMNIAKPDGYILLTPGDYAVTAIEFDSTLSVGQTSKLFTPGHTWVNWPTSPFRDWANVEEFGMSFSKAYAIRMNLINPCSTLEAEISSTEASCGTCNNGTALVVVNGGVPPYIYSWTNGSDTAASVNLLPGDYSVTITDNHGCSIEKSVTVGFTSDIPGLSKNSLRIYPNPSNGSFNIEVKDNSPEVRNIKIMGTDGILVYSAALQDNKITVKNLAPGTYVLQIESKNEILTRKIIVKP